MSPEKLQDFATRYTAAWCSQDPSSVAAFFAEYGSLTINEGTPAIGREAVTDVAQSFMAAFSDLEVCMDRLDITADHVKYLWTLNGTNDGPNGTGNKVRISGYEEWIIDEDGLVAESRGHYDNEEFKRQLEHGIKSSDADGGDA
jgi:nuclear transport factor 2 (NTF2) superfamily protein